MPLAGWICPRDGVEWPPSYCFKACPARCHPLPVLAALADERGHEPGVFHVTEVFNPPKVVYLSRHESYYVEPESMAYVTFGTAYHLLMERGGKRLAELGVTDTATIEPSFRAEILTAYGKAILAGRADRYEPDTKTLWDYKTEKVYSIKKYLAGEWAGVNHVFQLNTYRAFMFPEAERLMLSCLVKDHGYQAKVRDGIPAIVNIEVPILDSGYIRELVRAKVGELLMNEADPSTIPDCQGEDLWGGKRCLEYCPVRAYCIQGQAVNGKEAGRNVYHKKSKTPRRN